MFLFLLLLSFLLFVLIIFNFFSLFLPFFSLQELLCALRVKTSLKGGGWLFCFHRPFQTFPDFLSTLCWKKCQGPSRNSEHLLYWVNITALVNLISLSKCSIKASTPKVFKWLLLLACLKSLEKPPRFHNCSNCYPDNLTQVEEMMEWHEASGLWQEIKF